MLPLDQNVFEFRKQFLKLAGGAFRVYDTRQRLLLFSEQKAWKLREDIRVYADEARTSEVLSIRTQQIIDFSPTFDVVEAASGKSVGSLKRMGMKSLLLDVWEIRNVQGVLIGKLEEESTALALVRRFLTNLIPQRYHFVIHEQVVGTFRQNFNPFTYRAVMDLSADHGGLLDRRLALAGGVLLLAVEGKQG